jgi:hypothetical protein
VPGQQRPSSHQQQDKSKPKQVIPITLASPQPSPANAPDQHRWPDYTYLVATRG